jgi:hypothetical protein
MLLSPLLILPNKTQHCSSWHCCAQTKDIYAEYMILNLKKIKTTHNRIDKNHVKSDVNHTGTQKIKAIATPLHFRTYHQKIEITQISR